MEIRLYNADLDFQGVIENQTSLLWIRRYFKPGEFELYAPITGYNAKILKRGNLISYRNASEAGVIEDIKFTQTNFETQISAKGRFLESYMDRRLIRPTINYSGTVEGAMRQLLTDAVPIPYVILGEIANFPEKVEFQATYKNLLVYEEKLARTANFGFRFRPNFTEKTITFEIYKGEDHSRGQLDKNKVIFSEKFNNINEATYTENDQILKNVAFVGGEGEGSDRIYVIVGDNTLDGLERRELFVDAKDISSEGLTAAEYRQMLMQRGEDKLNENAYSQGFECTTEANRNFVYKRDYDLGDIVTVQKENWGVSDDLRITEIMEVYEHGTKRVVPTLGDPLPETINWEDE